MRTRANQWPTSASILGAMGTGLTAVCGPVLFIPSATALSWEVGQRHAVSMPVETYARKSWTATVVGLPSGLSHRVDVQNGLLELSGTVPVSYVGTGATVSVALEDERGTVTYMVPIAVTRPANPFTRLLPFGRFGGAGSVEMSLESAQSSELPVLDLGTIAGAVSVGMMRLSRTVQLVADASDAGTVQGFGGASMTLERT